MPLERSVGASAALGIRTNRVKNRAVLSTARFFIYGPIVSAFERVVGSNYRGS